MRHIKTAVGVLLFLLGAGLVLLELGMAISESHALDGAGIALFAFFVVFGAVIAYTGYLLQRKPR